MTFEQQYFDIKVEYENLKDNDPLSAFALMKKASTNKEYLDSQVALWNKFTIEAEKQAKAIEAEVATEIKKCGRGIKEAELEAKSNEKVKNAWDRYFDYIEIRDKLTAQTEFLGRVYFDAKDCWETANEKLLRGANF